MDWETHPLGQDLLNRCHPHQCRGVPAPTAVEGLEDRAFQGLLVLGPNPDSDIDDRPVTSDGHLQAWHRLTAPRWADRPQARRRRSAGPGRGRPRIAGSLPVPLRYDRQNADDVRALDEDVSPFVLPEQVWHLMKKGCHFLGENGQRIVKLGSARVGGAEQYASLCFDYPMPPTVREPALRGQASQELRRAYRNEYCDVPARPARTTTPRLKVGRLESNSAGVRMATGEPGNPLLSRVTIASSNASRTILVSRSRQMISSISSCVLPR